MTKVLIAEPTDCDEIIQLQRLAYEPEARLYNDWTIPPLTQTSESLQQEFPHLVILKVVNAGKIVGSVRARLLDGVCHIARLIVHPEFQKRGIGSELLRKIEQNFGQAQHYELFTGSRSESNIQFYLAHWYEISHTKSVSDGLSLVYFNKVNRGFKNYTGLKQRANQGN